MARWSVDDALEQLTGDDRVLSGLVARHGPMPKRRAVSAGARFEVLARAIAHQQLSGRAAGTIWSRVLEAVGQPFTADRVLSHPSDGLRRCGLSSGKVAAIVDLARHEADGQLGLATIGRLDDDEIVRRLVRVRGVGPWTAQMFLMGALDRPDVWPVTDLGVRVGFGRAWLGGVTPPPDELMTLGERFRPWRSVVAWYCWRATEEPAGPPVDQRSTATPSGK